MQIIEQLTGGKLGVFDTPCPLCGPQRRKLINQRKRVLRIWWTDPNFATFHCARCGEKGHIRDSSAVIPDTAAVERARKEAAERERSTAVDRLSKARWLWSKRLQLAGSIAEIYLREARAYAGPLPATLGFLPPRGNHGPALIAAFGLAEEPEPGRLTINDNAVRGVHITRLAPDGSAKAGTDADKIMLGMSNGSPIVLAPANDLLGIAITEGIEDALSAHDATGLGAWAAGPASRLLALADAVPSYIEAVTIFAHADVVGQKAAKALAAALCGLSIEVFVEGCR